MHIAESAYTIERRLCVTARARDIIIRSAGKVVQPKLDHAAGPVAPSDN